MTDPVDLDAIRHAVGVTHSEVSALCVHVEDLIAENERLRSALGIKGWQVDEQSRYIAKQDARIAEQDLEATKLATTGRWITHYAIDTDEGRRWYSRDRLPADAEVVATRDAWEGPERSI